MISSSDQRLGASFRDPSGFLFSREGVLYRQINKIYTENYDRLISSKLYTRLVDSALLISHEEVSIEPEESSLAYKIIKPEPLNFISYPYEWSFSQLKDAALTTLAIQKLALESGMVLKDASAYNIQFHHGKPVLIDTLSFEIYREGEPWVAYRQFCQHFLAPLALISHRDVRLSQLLRVYMMGYRWIWLQACSPEKHVTVWAWPRISICTRLRKSDMPINRLRKNKPNEK